MQQLSIETKFQTVRSLEILSLHKFNFKRLVKYKISTQEYFTTIWNVISKKYGIINYYML
jgi:hypothetical protein